MGLTPTPQPVQAVRAEVGMPAPGAPVSGIPFPATPGRVPLGPSGARGKGLATRVGSLSDLDLMCGAVSWRT